MPETPSLNLFRRLGEWDADRVGELFAEEIDWIVPGAPGIAWAGPRTREEDVPAHFRTMWSQFDTERSAAEIARVIVEGDDAVALGTFSHAANTTGRGWTTPVAIHFTVKDGRITRVHLYEDTYAVAQAFGI
jgi:ketosteroid isomerase-like protein